MRGVGRRSAVAARLTRPRTAAISLSIWCLNVLYTLDRGFQAFRLDDRNGARFFEEADFSLHTHSRLSRRTRSAQRRTARQIASRDPASIGVPITIVAEADAEKTTATITMGTNTFKGAGLLVVIAIIAILIAT